MRPARIVGHDVFDRRHADVRSQRRALMRRHPCLVDAGAEHALDVAGDQVDFEVDAAAGRAGACSAVFSTRVRDQVDAQLAAVRRCRARVLTVRLTPLTVIEPL